MSEIDKLLGRARGGMRRLEPSEALAAQQTGALLVDIRPVDQRTRDGVISGAIVIDRNVLEWRLDPSSSNRIAESSDTSRTVILICNEGYSSSLAASTLRSLGLRNATDVAGGFQAWLAQGLPVESGFPGASGPGPDDRGNN